MIPKWKTENIYSKQKKYTIGGIWFRKIWSPYKIRPVTISSLSVCGGLWSPIWTSLFKKKQWKRKNLSHYIGRKKKATLLSSYRSFLFLIFLSKCRCLFSSLYHLYKKSLKTKMLNRNEYLKWFFFLLEGRQIYQVCFVSLYQWVEPSFSLGNTANVQKIKQTKKKKMILGFCLNPYPSFLLFSLLLPEQKQRAPTSI